MINKFNSNVLDESVVLSIKLWYGLVYILIYQYILLFANQTLRNFLLDNVLDIV